MHLRVQYKELLQESMKLYSKILAKKPEDRSSRDIDKAVKIAAEQTEMMQRISDLANRERLLSLLQSVAAQGSVASRSGLEYMEKFLAPKKLEETGDLDRLVRGLEDVLGGFNASQFCSECDPDAEPTGGHPTFTGLNEPRIAVPGGASLKGLAARTDFDSILGDEIRYYEGKALDEGNRLASSKQQYSDDYAELQSKAKAVLESQELSADEKRDADLELRALQLSLDSSRAEIHTLTGKVHGFEAIVEAYRTLKKHWQDPPEMFQERLKKIDSEKEETRKELWRIVKERAVLSNDPSYLPFLRYTTDSRAVLRETEVLPDSKARALTDDEKAQRDHLVQSILIPMENYEAELREKSARLDAEAIVARTFTSMVQGSPSVFDPNQMKDYGPMDLTGETFTRGYLEKSPAAEMGKPIQF